MPAADVDELKRIDEPLRCAPCGAPQSLSAPSLPHTLDIQVSVCARAFARTCVRACLLQFALSYPADYIDQDIDQDTHTLTTCINNAFSNM